MLGVQCPKPIKKTCDACGKPLQAIGAARRNGTARHRDWSSRRYHKQCYRAIRRKLC